MLAAVVGVLYASGTYLLLRRSPIKLILGLALLSHGTILIIFGTGTLKRGLPPIIADKAAFTGDISAFVDPLPQALILTAIVISFGVTAFTVVLVNRRNTLTNPDGSQVIPETRVMTKDPFAALHYYESGLDEDPDDYEWLEYSLADERRRELARQATQQETAMAKPARQRTKPRKRNGA